MGFGDAIYNLIPNVGYMLIHILALLIGLYTASLAMKAKWHGTSKLLLLYSLAEFVFLLAHMDVFTLPFAHLLAEVLLLVGVLLVLMDVRGAGMKGEGMKKEGAMMKK